MAVLDAEQGEAVSLLDGICEGAKLRDGLHVSGTSEVALEDFPVEGGQEVLESASGDVLEIEMDLGACVAAREALVIRVLQRLADECVERSGEGVLGRVATAALTGGR